MVSKTDSPVTLRSNYLREDAKTVSIISMACFHPSVKVQNAAMHFFMESGRETVDDDTEDYVSGSYLS